MSGTEYENETDFDSFDTQSDEENPDATQQLSDISITSEVSALGDIKCYKRTVKRQDDGMRLCNDLMTLMQERADIEKHYAKSLKAWSKKWEEAIDKGPEYHTTKAAWKAAVLAADSEADLHLRAKDKMLNDIVPSIKQWTSKHFHKPVVGPIKETKNLEEDFRKAQKPWAHREHKVVEAKKKYHAACKLDRSAALQESNARGDSTISPEQLKKIQEKADKAKTEVETTKESYEAALKYLEAYNARYTEDMAEVFEISQKAEEKRLRFFKEKLIAMYHCLDLPRNQTIIDIYNQYYITVNQAEAALDLQWWSENYGVNMSMTWPCFEESPDAQPRAQASNNNNVEELPPDRRGKRSLGCFPCCGSPRVKPKT